MPVAQLDNAPSASPSRSAGSAGQKTDDAVRAARAWLRLVRALGRVVEELDDMAVALVVRMSIIAGYRRQHGKDALPFDINPPFDLVKRAMRWLRALEIRLAGEAAAAKAALFAAKGSPEKPERTNDGQDWQVNRGGGRRERVEPADIEGKSTAEVFAQICADLKEAARLLSDEANTLYAKVLSYRVDELLGRLDEMWTPEPMGGTPVRPAWAPEPERVQNAPTSAPEPTPTPGTG